MKKKATYIVYMRLKNKIVNVSGEMSYREMLMHYNFIKNYYLPKLKSKYTVHVIKKVGSTSKVMWGLGF